MTDTEKLVDKIVNEKKPIDVEYLIDKKQTAEEILKKVCKKCK